MFQRLRNSRSLIMGLAIFWVAFYHIPWIDRNPVLDFLHDIGYIGVDVFLLISGIGACHSIGRRGGKDYLKQRAGRILPGLIPVVVLWSVAMMLRGVMNLWEFFGGVTLLGWWLGQDKQLNWYFSAVWMYFLLAVALYRPIVKGKHPVPLVLAVSLLSFLLIRLTPFGNQPTAFSRIPVFLVGMLLGRVELEQNFSQRKLKSLLYALFPVGLALSIMTWHSWGDVYGYSLGLWWYPFALVVPGGMILISELAERVRGWKPVGYLMRPFEWLGEASSEVLMIHVAVYKLIQLDRQLYPKQWMVVMLGCMILGVLYHRLVVKRLPS